MAEFTRFSETILTKQDQRVVSITVKPMISDCTGRIYFTDLMVQEGDRLTGYWANEAAYRWGLRGIAIWSLGQEDMRLWEVMPKQI